MEGGRTAVDDLVGNVGSSISVYMSFTAKCVLAKGSLAQRYPVTIAGGTLRRKRKMSQ